MAWLSKEFPFLCHLGTLTTRSEGIRFKGLSMLSLTFVFSVFDSSMKAFSVYLLLIRAFFSYNISPLEQDKSLIHGILDCF